MGGFGLRASDFGPDLKELKMDSGISTVRNLLYIVLVLAVLGVCANAYLGVELAQNSEELSRLSDLLQKQLMTSAAGQSQQMIDRMDQLHRDADSFDTKMDAANKKFFRDLNDQLPKILDKYVQSRAPMIERQAIKQMPH
jgi:hypothetical protein